MKNSLKFVIALSTLICLSSQKSLASEDKYSCRATCIVVDALRSTMYSLGSVKGLSERDTSEAFDVMEQACKNKATAHGMNGEAISLIKGMAQISAEHAKSDSSTTQSAGSFKLGFIVNFSRSTSSTISEAHSTANKFSYELHYADESSCGEFKSNPNGNPKYIGQDQPLG